MTSRGMTGTRFARTGRCRFFVCLAILISVLCMLAIFHSSQQQLDETREQRLRCERQQEQLNEQLQNMVEQKYNQQKSMEQERSEQMEARHSLEQKLKELNIMHTNEQTESRSRYDKLQQAHKLLQSEHNELVSECQKTKKQLLESTNGLEKKLKSVRSEAEKENKVLDAELALWRAKYYAESAENNRLENILKSLDEKSDLQSKIINLERVVAKYQQHCDYRHDNKSANRNNLTLLNIIRNTSLTPRRHRSFNQQVPVSPGLYRIDIKLTNKTQIISSTPTNILPKPSGGNEGDLNSMAQIKQPSANQSLASVGPKLIQPLSAPRKNSTTETSKSEQHVLEANAPAKQTNSSSTTSSGLPPLPMPPNQRKLPDNVAPIPAFFEELLKNDHANENGDVAKKGDINAALEGAHKNDNDKDNNNRYANAIDDMEPKASQKKAVVAGANAQNEDSGAHEIKDNDFINDQNFNLPADENKHFFDGGGGEKNEAAAHADEKRKGDDNDDDEGIAGAVDAGDIAVKNHNILDVNNLNNEVAGDQGKEFPDELRLEENNEEDEDEDDYSNPGARQQGEQPIRN